jgi:glycosyltransferase involved in cell wall biosynthesis
LRRSTKGSPHKIAHILPFPAVGGTEHATLRIAQALDPSRFTSLAFHLAEAEPVRAIFTDAGVRCAVYEPAVPSYRHAVGYLRSSLKLARQFREQRVHLVHCADMLAAHHAAMAGRLAGIPVLCHIRNRFDATSRRDCSFLRLVHRFVFVSRNTWQHFACAVPPGRGVVVYDGIDVPLTASAGDDRESVRREFHIPEHAPIIGMLARVAPQKDFATLARAAARILQVQPGTRFLVAGDYTGAGNREHYQEVRRDLEECGVAGSFLFTGYRQDVPRLLNAMDVFVLSTHKEGLPLVILEAMARAKPVVATAVDGVPEIIQDGETGLLFPHEDHEQLAAHVIGLLRDRQWAARLGEAGLRVVQTRFSKEQFAAGMGAVYAALLEP